jgi:hypothetical protein
MSTLSFSDFYNLVKDYFADKFTIVLPNLVSTLVVEVRSEGRAYFAFSLLRYPTHDDSYSWTTDSFAPWLDEFIEASAIVDRVKEPGAIVEYGFNEKDFPIKWQKDESQFYDQYDWKCMMYNVSDEALGFCILSAKKGCLIRNLLFVLMFILQQIHHF